MSTYLKRRDGEASARNPYPPSGPRTTCNHRQLLRHQVEGPRHRCAVAATGQQSVDPPTVRSTHVMHEAHNFALLTLLMLHLSMLPA
jgi:hypothetical protein